MQLAVSGLRVRFGPLTALDGVDLTVRAGEVVALAGENGAGKSTLIRCIAGDIAPTSGVIALDGRPVPPDTLGAKRQGISVVWQDLALCDNLDIASNVLLGRERRRQPGPGGPDDLGGGARLGGPEQVADLAQREAQPPGPADEGQPPPVILGVLTESGPAPGGLYQQPTPLIEPDRLDPDPFGVSEFPDRQPSHSRQASSRTPVRSQARRRPHLTRSVVSSHDVGENVCMTVLSRPLASPCSQLRHR